MISTILIMTVEQDGDDGILVTFSDGTEAGYVVDELLELRPSRFPATLSDPAAAPIPHPAEP